MFTPVDIFLTICLPLLSHSLIHNSLAVSGLRHQLFSSAGHICPVALRRTYIVSLSSWCCLFFPPPVYLTAVCHQNHHQCRNSMERFILLWLNTDVSQILNLPVKSTHQSLPYDILSHMIYYNTQISLLIHSFVSPIGIFSVIGNICCNSFTLVDDAYIHFCLSVILYW